MPDAHPLEPGLYETPITRRLDEALAVVGDLAVTAGIEPADAHVLLLGILPAILPQHCKRRQT